MPLNHWSLSLAQRVSGVWSSLDSASVSSTQGTEYTIRVECDGQNVSAYRSTAGQLETKILETTACTVASTNYVSFSPSTNADFSIDDIRILADGLSNTTTFAVNNANELTSMTGRDGTTSFGFDAWGRMTSKSRDTYSASYYYNYGSKLTKVSSGFPGEGTVDYVYGADQKRRECDDGTMVTWYNYDIGWNLLNEETDAGVLTVTYVHDPMKPIGTVLADLAGATPAAGTARYYFQDNIGSTRCLRYAGTGNVGQYEYEPYGGAYSQSGATIMDMFTGHDWDGAANLYYAPYRHYSSEFARWATRDPLGMVDGLNLYSYTGDSPIRQCDALGLTVAHEQCIAENNVCKNDCDEICCGDQSPFDLDPLSLAGWFACHAKCEARFQACMRYPDTEKLLDYCAWHPFKCAGAVLVVTAGVIVVVGTGGTVLELAGGFMGGEAGLTLALAGI